MPSRPTTRASRSLAAALLAVSAAAAGAVVASAPAAHAAKGGTCAPFTVTTGGRTYTGPDLRTTIRPAQVGPTITVQGKYVRFSVRPTSLAVDNYLLTGANSPRPDKDLPIDEPTRVFVSKVPQLAAPLTSGIDLRLEEGGVLRLERSGGGQDMKIQAKNCAQGGLFQMEPEPGTTMVHTLAAGFRYDGYGPEGRLCITNDAFSAYDSPQAATALSPVDGLGTQSSWAVASGGRMGFVVGEDAVEGGCTP